MKLVTDNAFTKAWKISCPTCRIDQPNSILWFKKQCHECEIKDMADKKYTEEDLQNAWKIGYRGEPIEELTHYFQPKTEWEVELIDGKLKLK